MNEKKNKEMTKEQMKEYFYNIIEDLRNKIQHCKDIINCYEEMQQKGQELDDTQKYILDFNRVDKFKYIDKQCELEEMFEKMFAIRYFDYSWNKKQESEEM